MEHARLLRQRAEDGIRLMFHVGCEREWFVFVAVEASLYLVSLAAKHLDFPTLCFIGIYQLSTTFMSCNESLSCSDGSIIFVFLVNLVGILWAMTVPLIYVKNEHKIREYAEDLRMGSQRLNVRIEENLQKVKNKIAGKQKEIKEKKTE